MKIWSTVSHKGYPHHISGSRSRVGGYDWSEQLSKDKVYALFKTLHHTFERRLTFDNSFDQIVLERLDEGCKKLEVRKVRSNLELELT